MCKLLNLGESAILLLLLPPPPACLPWLSARLHTRCYARPRQKLVTINSLSPTNRLEFIYNFQFGSCFELTSDEMKEKNAVENKPKAKHTQLKSYAIRVAHFIYSVNIRTMWMTRKCKWTLFTYPLFFSSVRCGTRRTGRTEALCLAGRDHSRIC